MAGEPADTSDMGSLACAHGTVHAHMGKHVSTSTVHLLARMDTYCVYWAYRPTHSSPGHFTRTRHYLGTQRHSTPTNRGPLVLGSQTHWHLFRSSREPPLTVALLYLALLKKQSLAFCVRPERWPIILSHTLLPLREYLLPFCRSCFSMPGSLLTPGFHPLFRMSSSPCLGFLRQLPVWVLLLASHALNFLLFIPTLHPPPAPTQHTPLQIILFTPGGGSWALSCSFVCVSL